MQANQFKLDRDVTAVLHRHSVRLSGLTISTLGQTVCIEGKLTFTDGLVARFLPFLRRLSPDEMARRIRALERDIARLDGVRYLKLSFVGWSKSGSHWQPEAPITGKGTRHSTAPAS